MIPISISLSKTLRTVLIPFAAVCLLVSSGFAETAVLRDVRVGTHRHHDRLVMELDHEVQYSINTDAHNKLIVRLQETAATKTFVLPQLRKDLEFISTIEAFLVGSKDLEIEVALRGRTKFDVQVLEGSPWRLVVDISEMPATPPVDASKPAQRKAPDYVPGDKPIETRFAQEKPKEVKPDPVAKIEEKPVAEANKLSPPVGITTPETSPLAHADKIQKPLTKTTTHPVPETKPEIVPTNPVDTNEDMELTADLVDQGKASSILQYYYLAIGDTPSAQTYGAPDSPNASSTGETKTSIETAELPLLLATLIHRMPWILFAAVLATGILGGILGYWLIKKMPSIHLPKRRAKKTVVEKTALEPAAEDLERDFNALANAVKQEPRKKPIEKPQPVAAVSAAAAVAAVAPEPEPEPEAVASDEDMKETAMERRVKRVLELSKTGASVEVIAKQLEMSQDEVKLILDLN